MQRVTGAAFAVLAIPAAALACPFCDGVNGRNLVKEELFTENFWFFSLATVLPFAVCAAIVAWMFVSPHAVPKNS